MYSRRLLLFIVWKALEYEPAFEQGDAAGRGGCRSRCSVSPGGVTAATKGGYHFPSGGLNLTPLTPPALRSDGCANKHNQWVIYDGKTHCEHQSEATIDLTQEQAMAAAHAEAEALCAPLSLG